MTQLGTSPGWKGEKPNRRKCSTCREQLPDVILAGFLQKFLTCFNGIEIDPSRHQWGSWNFLSTKVLQYNASDSRHTLDQWPYYGGLNAKTQ